MEFKSLTDEKARIYTWSDGGQVIIQDPIQLNVSGSGGHRIVDGAGVSHYIPSGWIHLQWTVKEGKPYFAF